MFELICNALLWLALLYVYFFHVTEAPIPVKVQKNPYALSPDVWPRAIVVLLLVFIAVNIVRILRRNRGNPDFSLGAFGARSAAFLKSRTFLGILLVLGASFALEPLGFMGTCFLLLLLYGLLLGDRRVLRLVVLSAAITVLLYAVFGVLLSVNLPRGTLPQARDFALYVESLIARAQAAIF